MARHGLRHKSKLPELLPPPSHPPQESVSEQSYRSHSSNLSTGHQRALVVRHRQRSYGEPLRPDNYSRPPPPPPPPPPPSPPPVSSPTRYKHIEVRKVYATTKARNLNGKVQYYSSPAYEGEFMMSGARLLPQAAPTFATSRVAFRAPERRLANLTSSEELPPGLPAQVTFVAAHHCAACGRPRSHAYHKGHPLIPGQVAPSTLCRKCEKKIAQGKPIDSIVVPIKPLPVSDAESKQRDKRKARPRSSSHTRVVVRYGSRDRSESPAQRAQHEESPGPPRRSISFRHVRSRSLSRPAASSRPQGPLKKAQRSAASTRLSSLPRRVTYVTERVLQEHSLSDTTSEAKTGVQPSTANNERTGDHRGYYDYTGVDVQNDQRGDNQRTLKRVMKQAPTDLPPPPMGLSALQVKRASSLHASRSAGRHSYKGHPHTEQQHVSYIRRSPSPPQSYKPGSRTTKQFDAASHTATDPSSVTIYGYGKSGVASRPEGVPDAGRSDYNRYQEYHNRPPSPPPATTARTRLAPNTIEYILGDRFHQNPDPGATKAYSEASVMGSKPPASRVAFTESEVAIAVHPKARRERSARSHARRQEREDRRMSSSPYGHAPG